MKKATPGTVQIAVYQTLERLGTGTIKEITKASGLTEMQVIGVVDRFIQLKKAYVCDWRFESANSSCRVIKLGNGVSVERWKSGKGKERIPKGDLHLLDYRQQHLAHQEFMRNFRPRPDVAAAWLLNPVDGELA